MSIVIQQLHQDHARILRLLDFLDRESRKAGSEETPDFLLMREVMLWMTRYPDAYHHPREDRIFTLLSKHQDGLNDGTAEVIEEHDLIAERGRMLLAAIDSILAEATVRIDEFVELAGTYSKILRSHVIQEEAVLFPLAERRLDDEEWAAVDAEFEEVADPVFGSNPQAEFGRLVQAVAP